MCTGQCGDIRLDETRCLSIDNVQLNKLELIRRITGTEGKLCDGCIFQELDCFTDCILLKKDSKTCESGIGNIWIKKQ